MIRNNAALQSQRAGRSIKSECGERRGSKTTSTRAVNPRPSPDSTFPIWAFDFPGVFSVRSVADSKLISAAA